MSLLAVCLPLIILTFIEPSSCSFLENEKDCPKEALIFPSDAFPTNGSDVSEYSVDLRDFNDMKNVEVSANGTCPCLSKPCLAICCPPGHRIVNNTCIETNQTISYPAIHRSNLDQSSLDLNTHPTANDHFHVFVWDPCHGDPRYRLDPETEPEDDFRILENGSIYILHSKELVTFEHYCLGYVSDGIYSVVRCFDDGNAVINEAEMPAFISYGLLLSVPLLLATFVVYSILPELRNRHGLTLRGYVGPLTVAYTVLAVIRLLPQLIRQPVLCAILAFIIHFSFLSSFFWLNVMCFDIWWTFGGFRALQGTVKQRERKKFIIYSIYAWGCASVITAVCVIMDYAPGIPDSFIKPKFGEESCWFSDDASKAVYFYGPMGLTVICNICLFISTALKILQHKRDTATQLKGMDSRRHDDNKQWFNLYLKLFIVMGINWAMEIISWLLNEDIPQWVWYLTDLTNTLQGVIIFIIFVWKDKIKRLLLKRFGCQNRNCQSRNSTRSACHSSGSNRTCTSTTMAPLQDKNHFSVDKNRVNTTTDESDCV